MLALNNALVPQIVGPGLQIQVYQGSALINGGLVSFPTTIVGLLPSTSTWVFINISGSILQTNNTGFPANSYPIAVITTSNSGVASLRDVRPDYTISASGSGFISGRFILNSGTLLAPLNFTLSGWGSGAVVSSVSGRDSAHSYTITATGIPQVAPQVTLTFADGAWGQPPMVLVQQSKGTGSIFPVTYSSNTTSYTLTFNGLPIAGSTYLISVLVVGLS